jgi:hypothetical protein
MKILILPIIILAFTFGIFAQSTIPSTPESKPETGKGIVFKIPEGVMPLDWKKNSFKGLLMLAKEDPTGVFITSPNDGETVENITNRIKKWIVPVFGNKEKDPEQFQFTTTDLPIHQGDKAAKMYLYEADKQQVQILIYERETNGSTFLYGYFAMKNDKTKSKDLKRIWANDKGEGIKVFDAFWKSFPKP